MNISFLFLLLTQAGIRSYSFVKIFGSSGLKSSVSYKSNGMNELLTKIYAKRRTNISKFRTERQLNEIGEYVDKIEEDSPIPVEEDILTATRSIDSDRRDLAASLEKQLQEDIKIFKSSNIETASYNDEKYHQSNGIASKIKELFSALLVADFFLILLFLTWFIAATISKEVFSSYFLIEKFQDIFQPVIQPALGLLMIGSVSSAVLKDDTKSD